MMSNPCISRHMFGPLPRLQTSERFAGVGTFFAFWGDLGQSRTAPKSSARLRYIERPHQSLEPTAGRSDDQFITLLRSVSA